MNWRKAALWTVGVAALLLVAASVLLHVLVDPERLKKAALDRAQTAWQRELLLGEVEFHLFPVPSLRASRVSLANPAWATDPHLLQADSLRADLALLPLLTGKVRIKSLAMDGVKAGLEVADDGAVSWELKGKETPATTEGGQADPLQIASVHIHNARIVYRRQKADSEPWLVEDALLEAPPGLKDARIEAKVAHHGRTLQVKGTFSDLSRLGTKGAFSDGRFDLDWGRAKLAAEGRFPLEKSLGGMDLAAHLEAAAMEDLFEFFGVKRGKTAPLDMKLRAKDVGEHIAVSELAATLGTLTVKGDASITLGEKHSIHARLETDRLDWLKTLADAGGTIRSKRNDGVVFHEDPIAWRAVKAIGSMRGTAQLSLKSFKMGNGLELANVKTRMTFGDGRMEMAPFAADMLGGAAKGAFAFDSNRKSIRFDLDGDNLLLERWFHERGRKIPFTGGPMKVHARLSLAGGTYREMAASVTGPFTVRMGSGRWESQRAGEVEEIMVRALQPKDGQAIQLQCASADLEFKSGRASGKNIIGARSDVSQLLTSGHVDFRDESIDLRGNVYARSGVRIGLASIASDVQIAGTLAKPTLQLDPNATPAVLARAGAAIASAGATLIGGALVDALEAKNDPCEKVFK
ncbi:MAG: AsmA family protein [Usitatibacter sp.]